MEKFSVGEIIEQAIQTEKLGYKFYTVMAEKFKESEELKNLFETLAVNEQQHEKKFSEIKSKSGSEIPDNWEEVAQYLRAIIESEFFLDEEKSLLPLEHVKSTAEAVNFAIGFEKETLLYFHSLRDIVTEKEIVNEIIEEEKSHIRSLSDFRKTISK